MALIGTVFTFVFFPMIVMDPPQTLIFSDVYQSINVNEIHTLYTTPIAILYGISASTVVNIAFSFFLNSKVSIRDVVYGPIAGAIATSSAAYYITNPVWAMLVGSVAGIIQAFGNYY